MFRRLLLWVSILTLVASACSSVDTQDSGTDGSDVTNNANNNGNNSYNSDDGYATNNDSGDYNNTATNNANNWDNDANNSVNNQSGTGVNIGGAQDFGVFRSMVENGEVPSISLLDPNGFFSEHYIQLPPATCGHSVCLYTMLGRGHSVLSDDFMTVLALTMISPIKPSDMERPPTDFVFVLDRSGSMAIGDKLEYMKQGIIRMLDTLNDDDRVSIVVYDDRIDVLSNLVYIGEHKDELKNEINNVYPRGQTNIYDALQKGFEVIENRAEEDQARPARVLFLSDGQPTAGIMDADAIVDMAASHVGPMVNLTSIGVGSDINYDLMKNLAMEGGNFYYVEDSAALVDIFVEEANYFPVPIAIDARIDMAKGDGFRLGEPVGFPDWEGDADGGHAEFANLYLASRTTEETENGDHARRGGGSIMFMKLMPYSDQPTLVGLHSVLSYHDPMDDSDVEMVYEYNSYFGTETLPVESEYYSDPMAIKSFAMLNAYLAFKYSVLYYSGEYPDKTACDAISLLNHAMAYMKLMSDRLVEQGAANEDGDDDLYADGRLMAQLAQNIYWRSYCGSVSPMTWEAVLAGYDPDAFEGDDGYYDDDYGCVDEGGDEYPQNDEYVEMSGGCSVSGSSLPSPVLLLLLGITFAMARRRRSC